MFITLACLTHIMWHCISSRFDKAQVLRPTHRLRVDFKCGKVGGLPDHLVVKRETGGPASLWPRNSRVGPGGLIDCTGLVEDDARRGGFTIAIHIPRYFLKHPIEHADMKMHMFIEVGAEAVNEGDSAKYTVFCRIEVGMHSKRARTVANSGSL